MGRSASGWLLSYATLSRMSTTGQTDDLGAARLSRQMLHPLWSELKYDYEASSGSITTEKPESVAELRPGAGLLQFLSRHSDRSASRQPNGGAGLIVFAEHFSHTERTPYIT